MPLLLDVLPFAVVGLGVGSALASTHGRHRLGVGLKVSAATGYLGVALGAGALSSSYGRTLLIGLALCWVGDLFLIRPGRGFAFLAGLVAFLLGHVAYALAFAVRGIDLAWLTVAALPTLVVGGGVLVWLWQRGLPPSMQGPVVAYVISISGMVALSWACAGAGAPAQIPAGAVAFLVSDVFVARERFVEPAPLNTRVGLPLYFLAQVLLALSV